MQSATLSSNWIIFCVAILLVQLRYAFSQYNFCLMAPGCRLDECCFPVMINFGQNCYKIPSCSKTFEGDCCFNSHVVRIDSGHIYGFAQLLDDPYGYHDFGKRYLNAYLGVRYAKPPSYELNLRFKKPEMLDRSQQKLMAMEYGPSCPQEPKYLKELLNRTISEDCLNMNIYVLNNTRPSRDRKTLYPIMVLFHGEDHRYGSANLYPGNILAQQSIMVVTVNYRLGAFGFLSTEDGSSQGNYGLWDQLAALEFVQKNGADFGGDVSRVTLVGYGSGAADVALHMLKPGPVLFHRAMWLSGSDLMAGGFVRQKGEAKRYAEELGIRSGCRNMQTRELVACLAQRNFRDLAIAADRVRVHGARWDSLPWAPSIDGDFLTDFPLELRRKGLSRPIRVIGGMAENGVGGRIIRERYSEFLNSGLNRSAWMTALRQIVEDDDAKDLDGASLDLSFEYTHWPAPYNSTWRLRKLAQLWTDRLVGSGLDLSLKFQSDVRPLRNFTQMFVLRYNSDPMLASPRPGSELEMMFGLPYLNDSARPQLGLRRNNISISRLDINMTDYMMYFVVNFVTHGNATPDIIRNLTWDTYRPENRTFFLLDLHNEFENDFDLKQDYRVSFYAFWQHYYGRLLDRLPRYTTPFPTPVYKEHLQVATFSLAGVLVLALVLLVVLLIVLIRKRRQLR